MVPAFVWFHPIDLSQRQHQHLSLSLSLQINTQHTGTLFRSVTSYVTVFFSTIIVLFAPKPNTHYDHWKLRITENFCSPCCLAGSPFPLLCLNSKWVSHLLTLCEGFLLQVSKMVVALNIHDVEDGTLEIGMGEYRFPLHFFLLVFPLCQICTNV